MRTLHISSVLAGAALLGLVAVTSSVQRTRPVSTNELTIGDNLTVRVIGIPDPRDYVVVREETGLYTVPQGKLFVLTALGTTENVGSTLYVNSQRELVRFFTQSEGLTVAKVPPGLSAGPGDVLQVVGGGSSGRAWGYLVDA